MVSTFVKKVHITGQDTALDVDTLATESAVSGEIDTGTATSPVTILTPSSGKRINTRACVIHSDSTSGEIAIQFASSGTLICKLYCSVQTQINVTHINLAGAVDEAVQIAWSGTTADAKIFYVLSYKEE